MAELTSADFVVIGSGIIGSLTARKLAKAGASVLILEAGPRVTRGELVARFRNSPRRSDTRAFGSFSSRTICTSPSTIEKKVLV